MNNFFKKVLTVLICLVAVVLFTALGISQLKARQAYTETTATITKITTSTNLDNETTHSVEITYTVDGEEYVTVLGEYNSSMSEGKEIQIKYNPESPSEVVTASYTAVIMYFVIAAIGLVAFFCAIIKMFR